jgi:restriction system protein
MAIPDYQSIMLPLLRFIGDGQVHSKHEAVEYLADEFELTEEERKELLPSGKQGLFDNRLAWAKTYIKQGRLIDSPKWGFFVITERGKQVLAENPKKIDVKYLERFPEFIEFRQRGKEREKKELTQQVTRFETNPEEALETAYQELQENLASELLENIKNCPSDFFERLVIDVLIKMSKGSGLRLTLVKEGGWGQVLHYYISFLPFCSLKATAYLV